MKNLLAAFLVVTTALLSIPLQSLAQSEDDPCWYDADFNQFCRQDDGSILEIPNPFFEGREVLRTSATLLELSTVWNGTALTAGASLALRHASGRTFYSLEYRSCRLVRHDSRFLHPHPRCISGRTRIKHPDCFATNDAGYESDTTYTV